MEYPLVSIIVITYNSSKYVLETLESAKTQTYKNIELIISDDCSSDNTVEVCQKWLNVNKDSFVRTEMITVDKNTGVSANCNRGVKVTKGVWLKLIAGDDILDKTCIEYGIDFIKNHPDTKVFSSYALVFTESKVYEGLLPNIHNHLFFNLKTTKKDQFNILLNYNPIPAVSTFILKSLYVELGGFDEMIPYMEDYPFWFKVSKNQVRIDFLPEITAQYRKHSESATKFNSNVLILFFEKDHFFRKNYLMKYYSFTDKMYYNYRYAIIKLFDSIGLNKTRYRLLYYLVNKTNLFRFFTKFDRSVLFKY